MPGFEITRENFKKRAGRYEGTLHAIGKAAAVGTTRHINLRREEADAQEKVAIAERALNLVRQHKAEQFEKLNGVRKAKDEAAKKMRLIETTVQTIERDADKAYVLLQNYRPGAVVDV